MKPQKYKAEVKVFDTSEGSILNFTLHAADPADLRKKVALVMETLVDEETEV